jgi:hypothetical protein
MKRSDPPVSEAQRKAMWAAKSGNSTLGIPKSVGAEFAKSDPGGHLPAKAKADDDCERGYMDAVRRGDAAGMAVHRQRLLGKGRAR